MNIDIFAIQLARMVANLLLFIDKSDEDSMDNDIVVHLMEQISADLESFDARFLAKVIEAFDKISGEYKGDEAIFVKNIPEDLSLMV